MANTKKYETYEVKITYKNGRTETTSYNGVNTSDWKSMLKVYSDKKEEYKNQNVTIEFLGISKEGNIQVIYNKELIAEELQENNEVDTIEATDPNNSIIKELDIIKHSLNKILDLKVNMGTREGFIKKDQDMCLHEIELYNFDGMTQEEIMLKKVELFDKLSSVQGNRRIYKNEETALKIMEQRNFDIKSTLDSIDSSLYNYKKFMNNEMDFNNEELKESIVRKINYNSIKQRAHLMRQMKEKYDVVTYDDKQVLCYNKGYSNSKNVKEAM